MNRRIDCLNRAQQDTDDSADEAIWIRAGMYDLFNAVCPICPHCLQRHVALDGVWTNREQT